MSETNRTGLGEDFSDRLLMAVVENVVFDGWSRAALVSGARQCGLEDRGWESVYPGGVSDCLRAFSAKADREMLKALKDLDLEKMRVRDKVAAAVRLRLEYLTPHQEAVRRGLASFALPGQAPLGLACLYGTVDSIWHGIGDRSTDYNFYSKRLLLAGVVSATTVFWLSDESEGKAQSWAFLERRIDEVLKVGGRFGKSFASLLAIPEKILARRF